MRAQPMSGYLSKKNISPYSMPLSQKVQLLQDEMEKIFAWHMDRCDIFRRIISNDASIESCPAGRLSDRPFLTVDMFKEFKLRSISDNEVYKVLLSSSTQGKTSHIYLDKKTAELQAEAARRILEHWWGKNKKVLLVMDAPSVLGGSEPGLSSRGTALKGLLPLAKRLIFLLNEDLGWNISAAEELKKLKREDEVFVFGFTWLLHKRSRELMDRDMDSRLIKILTGIRPRQILHTGGWKKIEQDQIGRKSFQEQISRAWHIPKEKIVNFYGLVEMPGVFFPECSSGHMHPPFWSEVIVRDPSTLRAINRGAGLIQLLSILPWSYPGMSVLTDDIGEIKGVDGCACGRKGKFFRLLGRASQKLDRGCSDSSL